MFVKAQNEKRFINLANVTDVYSERKTEGGKQKYVLYFDKIPAGSFSKQESIDNVIHRIGDCCVFIMDDNYKSNIIGCIAYIGFCNNCISVEEVHSSGQLTLLFTEHIKVIGRLED